MIAERLTPAAARRRRSWQLYAACVELGADAGTAALLDTAALFALRGRLLKMRGRL